MKLSQCLGWLALAALLAACASTPGPVQPTRSDYPGPGTIIPQGYPGMPPTQSGYPAPSSTQALPLTEISPLPPNTPVTPAETALPTPTALAPTPTPAGAVTQAIAYMALKDFEMVPAQLTIPVGTTVVFLIKSQSGSFHEPYSTDPIATFDSGRDLGDGATYAFTFRQAGTVTVLCGYHPNMRGTIVVQP